MKHLFKKLFVTQWLIFCATFFFLNLFLRPPSFHYMFFLFAATLMAFVSSVLVGKLFLKPIQQLQKVTQEMTRMDEQNKREMKQDQNELEALLSNMVEGVMLIGKDEKILLFNAPIYEMLELRSRETIGKPYWEVIRNAEINSLLKEAMAQKKSLKKEIAIISPEENQFLMQVSAILSESGILTGVVAVFHDITELKKLARMRSEFVANASHELKTPLTSIKGFVETLRDGAVYEKEKADKFLGIIQKHTEQLENLVNDLLSLSAIESREVTLNLEAIEIAPLVQSTVNLFKEQMERKGLQLSVNIPSGLPFLQVDRVKMGQVISNLLDNAIKFTPANGKITISAVKDNGFIRIDFTDSGIGIEPQHINRIFERFYRVDKGRSRELGGTGLGLSIVKHIVQSHNGKVEVKSEFGVGSTFSVFLPQQLAS